MPRAKITHNGFDVEVFASVEDALDWLAIETEDRESDFVIAACGDTACDRVDSYADWADRMQRHLRRGRALVEVWGCDTYVVEIVR